MSTFDEVFSVLGLTYSTQLTEEIELAVRLLAVSSWRNNVACSGNRSLDKFWARPSPRFKLRVAGVAFPQTTKPELQVELHSSA